MTGAQTDGQLRRADKPRQTTGPDGRTSPYGWTGPDRRTGPTDGQASEQSRKTAEEAPSQSGGTGSEESGQNGSGGNSTAIKDYPVTNMKPGKTYIIRDGDTLRNLLQTLQ
ncbi:MAG: hypothetical protein ACLUOI_11185 [Eisenbergiella sp.]